MGGSGSKLVFKKGIFRLSEEKVIPAEDPYWENFWRLPESAEDVFSLFSPADVRRTRDTALPNLETLLLVITDRLFALRQHPSFPDPESAPEQDALNCIRVLTRLLPYLYEAEHLREWEDKIFWAPRGQQNENATSTRDVLFDGAPEELQKLEHAAPKSEDVKPLAEELIDTLIDLLFHADFTIPRQPHSQSKIAFAIWQTGVGCNTAIGMSKEFESNRTEILRLLLTLTSQSLYMSANVLPAQGVKAITYIATCADKQVVLSLLCSLLNTTMKYNPATWRVPYNVQVFRDPKQILVTYALQTLLVILLYPIPESGPAQAKKHYFRYFFGRIHRPQDFQFIVDGMMRILNQPLTASTSYMPGNQSFPKGASEMIMLFWEITQCNKRFRSFIIDTDRYHDFVIVILFYSTEYRLDASKQGIMRMCAFILQTLSVEANFGKRLNKTFEAQDTLPASLRIQSFQGTYADFLIQSIYNIITTSQGKLTAIYPALMAVINNVAACLENINATTSSKLLHLFKTMSSPSFLLANDTNHDLLHSLLESMNAIIEHQYAKNPKFVYAIVRNQKNLKALRTFTLESGQQEIERRNRQRKENGEPVDALSGRRTSVDSIRSPSSSQPRMPSLCDVPQDSPFQIGDDDEDTDDNGDPTPAESSPVGPPSRSSSVASGADDSVPTQIRGMSEKARGKMPVGFPSYSRQNSTTSLGSYVAATQTTNSAFEPSTQWIESWVPELPLHTILTLLSQLPPAIVSSASSQSSTSSVAPSADIPSASVLRNISAFRPKGIDTSPIRVHSFEWSPLSLGWYESLLWSFIFVSEMEVAKGTLGVWNGTQIRLFRVQEVQEKGPTLSSPRGAVDAVGSNIVRRMDGLRMRVGGGGSAATQVETGSEDVRDSSSGNRGNREFRDAVVSR